MHTPGPWLIQDQLKNANIGYRAIIDSEGFTICNPSPMGEANACLIAAAPELLAALKASLYALSYYEQGATDAPKNDIEEKQAREKALRLARLVINQLKLKGL